MYWLWLAAIAVVPDEIAVRVNTPRCDLAVRVPDALERALPGVAIVGGDRASSSRVRFTLSIASRTARSIDVTLFDQAGEVALVREVPMQDDACTATADGVAVIVARHLRDLGWRPPDPAPEIAETATIAEAAMIAETATIAVRTPPEPSPTSTSTPSLELHLDAGLLAIGALDPGIEGRAHLGIGETFEVGVAIGTAPNDKSEDVFRPGRAASIGTITYSSSYAVLIGGACFRLGGFRGCLELHGGGELFSARSTGDRIFRQVSESVTRPVVRLAPRLEYRVVELLSVFVSAGLRYRPIKTELVIEDAADPVVPDQLGAIFGAGVFLRIF